MISATQAETFRNRLQSLVTVGQLATWLRELRAAASSCPDFVKNNLDAWSARVNGMSPGKSIVGVIPEVGNLYRVAGGLLNEVAGKPAGEGLEWTDVYVSTDTNWKKVWDEAQAKFLELVKVNPEAYRTQASQFVTALSESRTMLDQMKKLIRTPADAAKFNRLATDYWGMVERFSAETAPVQGSSGTGALAAIVLTIMGVGLTAAALAFAVGYFINALAFRDRVKLEREELLARVEASKEGRVLQKTTLEPMQQPKQEEKIPSYVWWGIAAAGAGLGLYLATGNRRNG